MLKNFKSLFIVPDEETTEGTETKSTPKPTPAAANKQATPTPPPNTVRAKVDNAILDKLMQALEENNQPGFDYFEFRKALLTLGSLQMDEATKFQSTFATAATMGVSLEKLLESIAFYSKVLQSEEDKFNKAIKEQTAINVNDRLSEKNKLTLAIKEKSDLIRKLTEEIKTHQDEIQKISSTIQATEQKINETSMNFNNTIAMVKNQLEQDAIKLKQYIK